jgi:Phytanoyl-CoA dioxygenase (PhyH)
MERASLQSQFATDGYVVVPGLLNAGEAQVYEDMIKRTSGYDDADFHLDVSKRATWARADGVTTTPEFWPLIFHPRLLEVVRALIGEDARYTQHSDIHVNRGAPGWHRDSACRRFGVGPDWEETRAPYRIVRVALYLQSYARSGSALGVIPGSHRRESAANQLELRALALRNRLRAKRGKEPVSGPLLTLRPRWIETEPGDCLIFDQRLLHSASRITGPKYAIFLSYGADDEHSRGHRRYYLYERSDLRYHDYPPELAAQLREQGLYLSLEEEPSGVL